MKHLTKCAVILAVLVLVLGFVSCSSNDDESDIVPTKVKPDAVGDIVLSDGTASNDMAKGYITRITALYCTPSTTAAETATFEGTIDDSTELSSYYWSSSQAIDEYNPNVAWSILFDNGTLVKISNKSSYRAVCAIRTF